MRKLVLFVLVLSCGVPKEAPEMASTVSLIQMLAAGVVTSAGAPIASGKVRFYLPATLTPVSVYSDTLAATPIAPPLTLTAGGTGIAYTKVPTRVIVKDSTDVTTLFDGLVNIERAEQQYIQSASINGGTETTAQTVWDALGTSFGGTAGLWKLKVAATATERNLTSVVNDFGISIVSFGADPTGAADSTTPIQNTVTYVASLGGGKVTVPPGTYKTTAAITVSASIVIEGAGANASIIRNTAGAGDCFTLSGNVVIVMRGIALKHSSSSSANAVTVGSTTLFRMEQSSTTGHVNGISGGGDVFVSLSDVAGTTNGISGTTSLVIIGGSSVGTSGVGIFSTGSVKAFGVDVYGGTAGIDMGAGGILKASEVTTRSGSAIGLRTAATTASVWASSCDWGPGATDARTGAPIAYSFSGVGNFTPLPLQTDSIRVIVTAAVTITVNAPVAVRHGQRFSILMVNNSGGAVVWSYNAIFKLQGGAAAAPSTGNSISSTFEYDALSSKYREVNRSAEIPI